MTPSETNVISQVHQLLAQNGYEVAEGGKDVLRARDLDTGVSFQVALEGNVLYMSVVLETLASDAITPDMMRKMLSGNNGVSTSAFRLYDSQDGRIAITLNNFCTLQNMGAEDEDDILSLAGYLMADLLEARELLQGSSHTTAQAK